ncbi:unnamed protein product [Spirodela intermedia]|uniref:Uncharacterized protein n=1 Tax=Spirodela intermedia TaxID=51605 RepID=A0A7I8JYN1_SPIIN|nr:unnamed protein product [Spirodela intermedia]
MGIKIYTFIVSLVSGSRRRRAQAPGLARLPSPEGIKARLRTRSNMATGRRSSTAGGGGSGGSNGGSRSRSAATPSSSSSCAGVLRWPGIWVLGRRGPRRPTTLPPAPSLDVHIYWASAWAR